HARGPGADHGKVVGHRKTTVIARSRKATKQSRRKRALGARLLRCARNDGGGPSPSHVARGSLPLPARGARGLGPGALPLPAGGERVGITGWVIRRPCLLFLPAHWGGEGGARRVAMGGGGHALTSLESPTS